MVVGLVKGQYYCLNDNVCVCVYTCIYTYMCICIYTCKHIHMLMRIDLEWLQYGSQYYSSDYDMDPFYAILLLSSRICGELPNEYVWMCMYMYICVYVGVCIYIYIYTYTYNMRRYTYPHI